MVLGHDGQLDIEIRSIADEDYDIELWGLSPTADEIPEDKAEETLRVPVGDQNIKLKRFLVWTYEL